MDDLITALFDKAKFLETALAESVHRGRAAALAERDYRIALAELILIQRDAGMPVSIIGDVCRGDRKVAKLKCDRDCAEVEYDSAKDAINVYKKEIDIIREQIEREWKNV